MQVMEAWDVIENDKVWVVSIGAVGSVCVCVCGSSWSEF